MQIIEELQSGFSTAANGTANVYARGTSTPVIYYNDFAGLSPVTAGTVITLDAQGAAEVYVNQLITLTVLNSSGATVSDSEPGDAAPLTEVRSLSFLGTDYVTAQSAAGNPTTLQGVLDRVLDSFGATDWNVLVNGSEQTIQFAISSIADLYFSVKSYGAVGDATADDTVAITAAITAATVGGGTVIFPAGIYRITSALALPGDVNLLGSTPNDSVIRIDHATNDAVVTSSAISGVSASQFITNLTIDSVAANTGFAISCKTVTPMLVNNCLLGGAKNAPATTLFEQTITTATAVLNNCVLANSNDAPVLKTTAAGTSVYNNCTFSSSAQARTAELVEVTGAMSFIGCTFDASDTTSGTYTMLLLTNTALTKVEVSDCKFLGGTGTVTAIATVKFGAGQEMTESGSTFDAAIDVKYLMTLNTADYPTLSSNSNMGTREQASDSTTIVAASGASTLDAQVFGNHNIELTGSGTTHNIDAATALCSPGAKLTVTIDNQSSSTVAVTFNNSQFVTSGAQSLLTTVTQAFGFVFQVGASGGRWVSTGKGA